MIAYFSATGNSLYVAQKLAAQLDDRLVSMADSLKTGQTAYALSDGEPVGLVLPVYFYTVPLLVRQWIGQLRLKGNHKPFVFAVLTCGGQTGQAGRILTRLLLRERLDLQYLASVVLPDNYIPLLTVPEPERQQHLFLAADQALVTIAGQLKQKISGDHDTNKSALAPLLTAFAAPLYKNGRKTDPFYATDRCTNCGLCERICPDNIIALPDGKPVWNAPYCTHCLACLHRCPVEAIQYGRRTVAKTRYVNPHVTWPV